MKLRVDCTLCMQSLSHENYSQSHIATSRYPSFNFIENCQNTGIMAYIWYPQPASVPNIRVELNTHSFSPLFVICHRMRQFEIFIFAVHTIMMHAINPITEASKRSAFLDAQLTDFALCSA